jgi:site-specific DNA recombinase
MAANRAAAESELSAVEREMARLQADLARVARDAATDAHAASRLADLHEKVRACEERAASLNQKLAEASAGEITKADVDAALGEFDGVWSSLTPKEQARLMRMLVQRVDYDATKGSVSITFHPLGLRSIGQRGHEEEAA